GHVRRAGESDRPRRASSAEARRAREVAAGRAAGADGANRGECRADPLTDRHVGQERIDRHPRATWRGRLPLDGRRARRSAVMQTIGTDGTVTVGTWARTWIRRKVLAWLGLEDAAALIAGQRRDHDALAQAIVQKADA